MSTTFIKLIGVFGLLVSAALCQVPAVLTVQGIGGTSATLSISDLSKLPQKTVNTMDHETPVTFEGVLLTDVLAKIDLPTGEKLHSTAASYYLKMATGPSLPGQNWIRRSWTRPSTW